eukprot:8498237-Pyramimonas_sp.AAC.1
MFGNPGNVMAYESSNGEVTAEASPSEVDRNLQPPTDLMPGNRPTNPRVHAELIEMESQAFVAG